MLACLAVTAATACTAPSASSRVVVAGDSLTALAQPALSAALDGRYPLDYLFRISARTDQITPLMEADRAARGTPDAVVVNLGTNDAVEGGRPADARAAWDDLVHAVRGVPCVVLTTVNTNADALGRTDRAATINARIEALAAAEPRRVKVVDWTGFVRGLSPAGAATYLRPDGIHETDAGAAWLAAADRAALASCGTGLPGPAPTTG